MACLKPLPPATHHAAQPSSLLMPPCASFGQAYRRPPCSHAQSLQLSLRSSRAPRLGHVQCLALSEPAGRSGSDAADKRPQTAIPAAPTSSALGPLSPPITETSTSAVSQPNQRRLPNTWDGVNWYCYTVCTLLFITDFTPLGLVITGGANAGRNVALLQWALFVAPTLWWCLQERWDLKRVFRLNGCDPKWYLIAASAGVGLWLATTWAISARLGEPLMDLSGPAGMDGGSGMSQDVQRIVFGDLLERPTDVRQLAQAFLTSALSPAVAEELLFRGLMLTAFMERLGRVDAVAATAALFALAHLSIPQFFGLTLLGFATGGIALASGSLGPAVLLHTVYNCTALAMGLAMTMAATS